MDLMSDSNKCMYVFLGVDSVNSLPLVNQVTTSPGEHFSATVFAAEFYAAVFFAQFLSSAPLQHFQTRQR